MSWRRECLGEMTQVVYPVSHAGCGDGAQDETAVPGSSMRASLLQVPLGKEK